MDATMPDRGLPLSLWGIWWNAILLLRPAFSRLRTFMWFVTAVAGLTGRGEILGVLHICGAVAVNAGLFRVGDGIKAPKRGKKMPAVKLLHQQSESNTKPEYIMGHSMQAVGLLVHEANNVFHVAPS